MAGLLNNPKRSENYHFVGVTFVEYQGHGICSPAGSFLIVFSKSICWVKKGMSEALMLRNLTKNGGAPRLCHAVCGIEDCIEKSLPRVVMRYMRYIGDQV